MHRPDVKNNTTNRLTMGNTRIYRPPDIQSHCRALNIDLAEALRVFLGNCMAACAFGKAIKIP